MCICYGEINTYENNDSCKQRLVIVRTLHIQYDFSLKVFFFHYHSLPLFIVNHPETVNCCISLFVSTFVGTLGENCFVSVQRDCNLENKRENCDGTDFKMGVAATLPELSEWTLPGVPVSSRTTVRFG